MSFNLSLREELNMTGHIAILYKPSMLSSNEPSLKNFEGNHLESYKIMKFIFDNYLLDIDVYC